MTLEAKGAVSMKTVENILPGTSYDWRHAGSRVAGYRVDAGQLLWSTDSGSSERALAVLVDGAPVEVVDVHERSENPRRLHIEWRPIGSKQEIPFGAQVALATLFESFLVNSERIDATREE